MELFETIRERRSYRGFSSREVEEAKIDMILEAANMAPSPANSQPWEFIVISGKAAREQIFSLSNTALENGIVEVHGFSYIRPVPRSDGIGEESRSSPGYSLDFLRSVPVIIAVVGLPQTGIRQIMRERVQDGYKYACAAAIQNMLLAAQAQGLGSLWYTFFDGNLVSRYLHIEDTKHLVALVCIGYPGDHKPTAPGKIPLARKVRRFD
ncbi:MAG: nitroreductase family protein [Thermoleophilia bacterium]